jgi:hypothetical protein
MVTRPAETAAFEDVDAEEEARRERLRREPDVIVRTRTAFTPFVSELRVKRPIDVLELIGRDDDDRDE